MQIEDELNLLFGHDFLDLIFNVNNLRMFWLFFTFPVTVQVISHGIASVVTQNNAINVNHRNDVNVKSPKEKIYFSWKF